MEARRHPQRGYWEVYFRYPHPDKPTHNKTFRKRSPIQTRRGAEAWGREMLTLYSNPALLRQELKPIPTFQTLARDVNRMVWKVGLSARTVLKYNSLLDNVILPALGETPIDRIDVLTLTQWRAALVEQGYSVEYTNAAVRVATQILRAAQEWELIVKVPRLRRLPPSEAHAWDYLREPEQPRLEAVLDEGCVRDTMLMLLLDTGLRDGEVRALTWGCIDLKAGTLWVKHSLTAALELGPTKNRKHRTIPLTSRAVRLLTAQRARTFFTGDFVFLDEKAQPFTVNRLLYRLRGRLKLAGLRQIRTHDLRHTFASRLVQRGASLHVVMELMGHSRIQETQRYAHLAPAQHEAAVGLLEQGKLDTGCTDEHHIAKTRIDAG